MTTFKPDPPRIKTFERAFAVWGIPAHPDMPADLHGTPVCLLDGMYAGAPDEGEALFRPLREAGSALMDWSGPAAYVDVQTGFDEFLQDGDLYYWKSLFLDELGNAAIDTMLSWLESRPNPRILVIIRHMGGAVSRIRDTDSAYMNRGAQYMLSIDGAWSDPAESEKNMAWIRGFWNAMNRFSNGGVYVNFPGFGEGAENLWRSSYGANHERLVAVKTRYDPANFFRMNQNIRPAGRRG